MFTKIIRYVGFRNVRIARMEKQVLELKIYKHHCDCYEYLRAHLSLCSPEPALIL